MQAAWTLPTCCSYSSEAPDEGAIQSSQTWQYKGECVGLGRVCLLTVTGVCGPQWESLLAFTWRRARADKNAPAFRKNAEKANLYIIILFLEHFNLSSRTDRVKLSFCCLFFKRQKLSMSLSEWVDLGGDLDRRLSSFQGCLRCRHHLPVNAWVTNITNIRTASKHLQAEQISSSRSRYLPCPPATSCSLHRLCA